MTGEIRVFHIITGLATGGAERALYNLLQGGLARQFNSHIISLSDEGTMGLPIKKLGIPVTTLNMRRGIPSFSGVLKLRRLVREFQPDLIQGWMYHGNLVATLARSFAIGQPVLVWNIRQSLYDLGYDKLLTQQVIRLNRGLSTSPDVILYNSHLSRQQHEAFGFSAVNGLVIPNGIDVNRFCFSVEARQRVRVELGIPLDARVVGHVARFHPMKDHPLFLRSAVAVAKHHIDLHFILSGRGVSHQNEELALIIPEELQNRFHLLGERKDVNELMCAMDISSSSSYGEAFPNVIGEAMASGVPCVVTDVGDSALIVGETGKVLPPGDEKAMIAGMEALLTMTPEQRQDMGAAARNRIEQNYTLDVIVKQYASFYEKLIKQKKMVD